MKEDLFDKDIRERLEKRTIQPSDKAWQLLEKRLEDRPERKVGLLKVFYGVAASIAVLIMAGIAIFGGNTEIEPAEVVVEQPKQPVQSENQGEEISTYPEKIQPVVSETLAETKKPETLKSDKIIIPAKLAENVPVEVAIAVNEMPVPEVKSPESLEDKKAREVASTIMALQQEGEVSESEIDALLIMARREIEVERLLNNGNKIDAMALLQSVEDELDQSFKEKVYEALIDGLEKVKTAVANRNQ